MKYKNGPPKITMNIKNIYEIRNKFKNIEINSKMNPRGQKYSIIQKIKSTLMYQIDRTQQNKKVFLRFLK